MKKSIKSESNFYFVAFFLLGFSVFSFALLFALMYPDGSPSRQLWAFTSYFGAVFALCAPALVAIISRNQSPND
jgi:hypothetical protein